MQKKSSLALKLLLPNIRLQSFQLHIHLLRSAQLTFITVFKNNNHKPEKKLKRTHPPLLKNLGYASFFHLFSDSIAS